MAAEMAISSPLLEVSVDGAHGVLMSIAGGSDLGLFEVASAASLIEEAVDDEANIIFGTIIDDTLGDEIRNRPSGPAARRGAGFPQCPGGLEHAALDPSRRRGRPGHSRLHEVTRPSGLHSWRDCRS